MNCTARVRPRGAAGATRHRWLWALFLALACAHVLPGPASPPPFVDPPRRGKPLVLVAMPDLESFHTVRRTLIDELRADFDLSTQIIGQDATAVEFARVLNQSKAACVVLMNNPIVNLYRGYQGSLPKGKTPVPAVVVMSSFLEELRADLKNATGVAYEVPGVSAFVSLRSVLAGPVRRVGVLHRPAFKAFLQRQGALAKREQIALIPAPVPSEPSMDDVRRALDSLRSSEVDALWVLNDNRLVENREFRDALADLGKPVVVGVPALLPSGADFGTLAVLPDLHGLGVQTANLILELAENGWNAAAHPVELPLSTLTFANMTQMRQRFGLRPGALTHIDRQVD